MYNQLFIVTILESIRAKVNNFCFKHMQASSRFDAEEAYWKIKEYGYETLGEYARTTFISRLFN